MMKTFFALLVLLAMLSTVGCGSKTGDRPKTYLVTGSVTLGGQPVDNATVCFQLSSGSGSSFGTTNASGKYKLSTFGGDDGARPGEYKVTILKYDRPVAQTATPAGQIASGTIDEKTYVPPDASGANPAAAPKNLLPAKYATVATSPLTAKVGETPENKIDFPLEP